MTRDAGLACCSTASISLTLPTGGRRPTPVGCGGGWISRSPGGAARGGILDDVFLTLTGSTASRDNVGVVSISVADARLTS